MVRAEAAGAGPRPEEGERIEASYRNPKLTVDAVVPLPAPDGSPGVVLVKRGKAPFEGAWALPGGYVEYGEPPEVAAVRELREETGIEARVMALVGVYGAPDRDPRGHQVSVVYELAPLASGAARPVGGDDARDAGVWPLAALPGLAFDHARILAEWRGGRRLPLD